MKTLSRLLFIAILSSLFIVSCDDHNVEEPQMDKEVIKDNVLTSKIVNDLFLDINDGTSKSKSSQDVNGCLTIKSDVTPDLKTWTMSISYNNCESDGLVKNGKVEVSFTTSWETGCVANILFDGYTVNGYSVDGKMQTKFEKIGLFNVESELKLSYADGSTTTWKDEKSFKMLTNGSWEINGTAEGKARNGKSFKRTETKLIKNLICPWYVGGEIKLTFNSDDIYDIVFGEKCGEVNYSYRGIDASFKL